jgi:hypothetical protein
MTMTNDQAIAYLAEMDREINVLLQARRAGQQISEILQHYKSISTDLDTLAERELALKQNIAELEKTYAVNKEAFDRQAIEDTKVATVELVMTQNKIVEAEKQLETLKDGFSKMKEEMNSELAALGIATIDKQEQLKKLEDGITEFKKQHGLA